MYQLQKVIYDANNFAGQHAMVFIDTETGNKIEVSSNPNTRHILKRSLKKRSRII